MMFNDLVDIFPEPGDEEYHFFVGRSLALVQTIGQMVDKISQIESRNTITASQVLYLRARIADLLVKWIPDPDDRDRAIIIRSPPGWQGRPHSGTGGPLHMARIKKLIAW